MHEIKHDGFRLIAWRDGAGVRLLTRRGNDWTDRFPLIVAAMSALKVKSALIDGEAVCCGINVFNGMEWQTHARGSFDPQRHLGAVTNLSTELNTFRSLVFQFQSRTRGGWPRWYAGLPASPRRR
jgi:hypothetical protein